MRADSHGFFWSDPVGVVKVGKRGPVARALPPIPDTGWYPPTSFPRLDAAKALCIDVETHDIGLEQGKGPGWAWEGGGEVIGLSVGTDDGEAWYFPVEGRVGDLRREGLPRAAIMAWAQDELGRGSQPKLGANIMYDIGWLRREGVRVAGEFHDVQFAEPLLNEHAESYALGTLAVQYGLTEEGKGTEEAALYEWLAAAYGGKPERRAQAGNIWRGPSALVGPYALGDVTLPFDIWRRQWKRLGDEGLLDLYRMECRLIPLLVEMRWRGVRVDVEGARSRSTWLAGRVEAARAVLGPGADPNSAVWLAAAFGQLGVPCSKTDKGNPSIPKGWLEYLAEQGPAPWLIDADAEGAQRLAQAILDIRRLEKARGTFIDGYILGHEVGGRVHGSFHPLRTDENGTVSGRLASSDPNLQNIPARDKEIKLWTRGLFLPEEGERLFSPDYSQLEYRLMVHRAVGKGAEEARQRYRDDPTTDYHTFTQELVREITGRLLPRKAIKNVNFGKIFGMGMGKLIETLGMSEDEAREFFTAYDSGIPFAKATLAALAREAATRGEILTIGGRKSRFPFYEPRRKMGNVKMLPLDAARQAYGADIVRAKTHKALNAYTQGGGGDIIKSAMLAVWDEGEVPLLTVHDELVFSLPPGEEGDRRGARILELMQGACPELSVPLLAVGKWGLNWGEVA